MTELQQTGYATLDGISQSGNDLVKFICNVLPSFYIVSYVMTLPLPCHAGPLPSAPRNSLLHVLCIMDSDSPAVPRHLTSVDHRTMACSISSVRRQVRSENILRQPLISSHNRFPHYTMLEISEATNNTRFSVHFEGCNFEEETDSSDG